MRLESSIATLTKPVEEVFEKLCECYRLEELNIDLSTNKIDIKSGEGLEKLEMLKNLRNISSVQWRT